MKSVNYFYSAIAIFLAGCTTKVDTSPVNPKYGAEIENKIQRITNNLQAETAINAVYESKSLSEQLKYYHTPGISIAVINEGKIEWARGFGLRSDNTLDSVDIHTLFEAGSVSKPTFALAVMRLKEKGTVDLDRDVNEYLKSWKIPASNGWQPKITLRQLLSHTAGLTVHGFPGYLKTEPIPTLPQILSGTTPANTPAVKVNILPGTTFRYSGGGTTVAQLTVMEILAKPFPAIMKEELFNPLKLERSTYEQPLPESLERIASTAFPYKGQPVNGRYHVYPEMAAAGLWTTPSELASLLVEVQRSLHGESSLFKKETVEEMLTPQKIAPHIGIGFFLASKGDSTRFGHNGWDEGFVTDAIAFKKLGKGAVVMVNSNEGFELLGEVMRAIAIEYQWPDFLPPRETDTLISMEELRKFTGSYSDTARNEFRIDNDGKNLTLSYQNQNPIPMTRTTKGNFRNNQFNFSISFEKDQMLLNQHGSTKKYKKK